MFKLCETLFLAGYDHMLMPDHAPTHPEDNPPPGAGGRVKQAWCVAVLACPTALDSCCWCVPSAWNTRCPVSCCNCLGLISWTKCLHRAFQFGYIAAVIQAVKMKHGYVWEDVRTAIPDAPPATFPKL